MLMYVILERCNGCGNCVEACSVGAIQLITGKAVIDEEVCISCETCTTVCPSNALRAITLPDVLTVPITESPVKPPVVLAAAPLSTHRLPSFAARALTFVVQEITPRLVDTLVSTLERRLTHPVSLSAVSPLCAAPRGDGGPGRAYRRRRRGQRG
jgi:NAD-dependent dihydropyrimidine dehydrogenase PreA subunit